jgi:hypothetical protein
MNELAWAVLIGASAFRLWRLVTWDAITEPIRTRLIKHEKLDRLAEFLYCAWCIGFWYCVIMSAFLTDNFMDFVVVTLASSTVAGLLSKLEN